MEANQRELNTRLLVASDKNDIESVKEFLEKGADINATDIHGRTALLISSTPELTKLLLEYGPDLNATDRMGRTVFHQQRPIEVLSLLTEAGANVNARQPGRISALMLSGTLEHTDFLLKAGADVNAQTKLGNTALFVSLTRSIDISKRLISAGADVNARNDNFDTPLMLSESSEITESLIQFGADVNAKDFNQNSVLMRKLASYDLCETFKERGNKEDFYAKEIDRNRTIETLIKAGADINYQRPSDGKTPLMLVESINDAKCLIAEGADITIKDTDGKRAHEQDRFINLEDLKAVKSYLETVSLIHASKISNGTEDNYALSKRQRL